MTDEGGNRRPPASVGAAVAGLGRAGVRALTTALGGAERTRVIVLLASVLALSSADASPVGASATPLRHALGISNTDIGLLVTVTSLVAAVASLPFGVLADRVRRTWTLGTAIVLSTIAVPSVQVRRTRSARTPNGRLATAATSEVTVTSRPMSVLLIPNACRSGVADAPTGEASALLSASTDASSTITRVRSAPPSAVVSARTPALPSPATAAPTLAGGRRLPPSSVMSSTDCGRAITRSRGATAQRSTRNRRW